MAEFQLRRMSSARAADDDTGDMCDCPDCNQLRADLPTQRRMLDCYLAEQPETPARPEPAA